MNLKYVYPFSSIGIILLGFGAGWITLSQILSLPPSNLTWVGAISSIVGLAITISTLSTIGKIDLIVEDTIKDENV